MGEFSSRAEKAAVVKAGIPNLIKYSEQRGDVSRDTQQEGSTGYGGSACKLSSRIYRSKTKKTPIIQRFLCYVCLFASFIISGSNYLTTWTFRFWKYFLMQTVVLIIHYIDIYFKIYCRLSFADKINKINGQYIIDIFRGKI